MIRRRVALIGLGIGRQHAAAYRALSNRFEIAAVCARSEESARKAADDFGAQYALTRFEDVLQLPDIDIVDLCTPPSLHVEQALAALRSGRHVVCEKPVAADVADIDRLAAAEAASGRRLMPIFQYRFGAGLGTLLGLQARGVTGDPLLATVEVHWRRRADYYRVPWRGRYETELGGALTSQAVHAIDALTCVLGDVRRVAAFATTAVNPIEVEDTAVVSLQMRNGALVTISVTLGSGAEITRHRFVFRNLVAESNTRPYSNCEGPWTFVADSADKAPTLQRALEEIEAARSASSVQVAPSKDDGAESLKGYTPPVGFEPQMRAFADALDAGTELPVTLADARRSVELLSAIYHSVRSGEIVELPHPNL